MPTAFVPCQYHVTLDGGDPLAVSVCVPHEAEEADGVFGVGGSFMVTSTEGAD